MVGTLESTKYYANLVSPLPDERESEELDDVTERLVAKAPQMFLGPATELLERKEALRRAVDGGGASGMEMACVERLRQTVTETRVGAFRGALTGEPPADVEPMKVTLKPGERAVRAKPRVYPPERAKWLATHMDRLVEVNMVYRNPQAIYGSAVMARPKRQGQFPIGV